MNFCAVFHKKLPFKALEVVCKSNILKPVLPLLSSERFVHKVRQGTTRMRNAPGVKRCDGDYVREGEQLVKQFYLHFHPGLNVNMDIRNTLTAMASGRVTITCEKISPKGEGFIASKFYHNLPAPVTYKRFFHVLPFPQGRKFNLVDLI